MSPDAGPAAGRGNPRAAPAALFFAVMALALFYPALFQGKLLFGVDTLNLGVPFHAEVARSLAARQWPLWMPDILGGMPGIASCNLYFLYPTAFIGSLAGLSLRALLGLDAALHVALAGMGMFLFLRRLDRGFQACLLGGFFFALSGSELSVVYGGYYNFLEGIAWVPWAFWAAHKAQAESSRFAWGLCGLAFSLQILAVAAQLFAYTLPAVACFALSEARRRAAARGPAAASPARGDPAPFAAVAGGLALALGAAALFSAPQLWPTLQYIPLSVRTGYTHAQFDAGSMPPAEALTWLVPGFFGWRRPSSEYFGLLPWALAVVALASLWRGEARVRWMGALALTALFLAQNFWTPFYGLFHRLPFVSGFRFWNRVLFLLTFAVCVLAAFGWDALGAQGTRAAARRGVWIFLGLALAACALALAAGPAPSLAALPFRPGPGLPPSPRALAAAIAPSIWNSAWTTFELSLALACLLLFVCARRAFQGVLALSLALAFHAVDQKQALGRYIRTVDPGTIARPVHFLQPPPPPAGLEPWRIYDYDPAYPNDDIMLGYENLTGFESVPMLSSQGIRDAMKGRPKDWADLMNERYFFFHSKGTPADPADRVTIYENHAVFPRAWLVGRSLKASGDEGAYRLLADPGFHPRDTVALKVDAGLDGPPPKGGVAWLARTPQAFSLAVSTDRAAALVVSNTWYPSWKADVDGRQTPVLEADGGLQAVLLGAGSHRVDFRFDPGLFYDALAACLAGLAFLAGLWWLEKKGPRTGGI